MPRCQNLVSSWKHTISQLPWSLQKCIAQTKCFAAGVCVHLLLVPTTPPVPNLPIPVATGSFAYVLAVSWHGRIMTNGSEETFGRIQTWPWHLMSISVLHVCATVRAGWNFGDCPIGGSVARGSCRSGDVGHMRHRCWPWRRQQSVVVRYGRPRPGRLPRLLDRKSVV